MKKDKLIYVILLINFSVLIILNSCKSLLNDSHTIRISGSDTMYFLTIRLASEYMKLHPESQVLVKGGGSTIGFNDLQSGKADLSMSSRNINSQEVKTLATTYSAVGMSYLIAKDALSIYVNWYNPIENLTLEQIKDIFTCKSNNWSNFGGKNDSILVVIRTPQSGTYEYFKSHLLDDEEYCHNALVINTTESVLKTVILNKNSIGYGGIGYNDGVKLLKVNGVLPLENNVRNETYPIIRYLYFYTVKSPSGDVKKFIDWVMSSEGQKIIDNYGYISIWE